MLKYTFHNVTISLYADNGKEAYNMLADALESLPVATWESDTYTATSSEPWGESHTTSELF